MFYASGFSCIDQVSITQVINCLWVVVALSVEGMRGSKHLLNSLAGARKGGGIAEVATHDLCPLLLQVRKAERISGHYTYRFALRQQMLDDNAAETAAGSFDQYHTWFLSRLFIRVKDTLS